MGQTDEVLAIARADEIMSIAREVGHDGERLMEALARLARRDVEDVLDVLHDYRQKPREYSALAELGRKLSTAAQVAADYEKEAGP